VNPANKRLRRLRSQLLNAGLFTTLFLVATAF